MKVKRFQAPTLREALLKVYEDLGRGAVVLTTRQVTQGGVMGLLGGQEVEVTASASDQPTPVGDPSPKEPTGILDRADQARDQLELGGAVRNVNASVPAATGKGQSSVWKAALQAARSGGSTAPAKRPTPSASLGAAAVQPGVSPRAASPAADRPRRSWEGPATLGVKASDEIRLLERQIRELEAALLDVARCADPDIAPGLPSPLARMQRR